MINKILYLLFFAIGLVVLIAIILIVKEHLNAFVEIAELSRKEKIKIKKILNMKRAGLSIEEISKMIDEETYF